MVAPSDVCKVLIMQERKNKISAFVLVGLILAIVGLWFFAFHESEIEVNANEFAVDDMANIDRVEMLSSRDTVVLRYDGAKWMVNDQYPADRRTIQVLFGTIEHVRPRRPVSEKKKAEVVSALAHSGTTVRFFVHDQMVKSYRVGGNAQKPEAIFQVEGHDPLVVNIPGYRVYASGVFEQTVDDWRDKRVFAFSWRNFKSLTTTFTKDPAETFTILLKDRAFSVDGMVAADTAKVNTYLDDVSLLVGEGFYRPGQAPRIDSLLAGPTSFKVMVTDIGNQLYELEVYPPLRDQSQVYGRVRGEIMTFKRPEMARIAKKKSWFRPIPE